MLANKLLAAARIGGVPVSREASIAGTTLAGGVTSVTFSGIHNVGDMLVAVGGSQSTTEPTYTAGWTRINGASSASDSRSLVVVYFIANTSGNITVTFTGAGNSGAIYSNGTVFRNASGPGANAMFSAPGITSTVSFSGITPNVKDGTSAVIAYTFAGVIISVSYGGPIIWAVTGSQAAGAFATGITTDIVSGQLVTNGASLANISVITEILA